MKRKRRKKQRKLMIISIVSLLFIMCTGYAAFQTNLTITAKGNIKDNSFTILELKNKYCNATAGDGLYVDKYEENKCIYRGGNPDNYITFNDEKWRILSVEKDTTVSEDKWILKIIRASSIGDRAWDSTGEFGSNNWIRPADLNIYLNTDVEGNYYYQLSDKSKNQIISHLWNVGYVAHTDTNLSNLITSEKSITTNSKIGLPSVTEYVRISSNDACTSVSSYWSLSNCNNGSNTHNWIFNIASTATNKWIYLLSPRATSKVEVFRVNFNEVSLYDANANHKTGGVVPALYLKSDLRLNGK